MAGKSEVKLLARKLAEKISDYLNVAYNHGYIDSSKDNCKPEKRIERVYMEKGHIMIASCFRDITTAQEASFSDDKYDKEVLVRQINVMLEDAEERGRKEDSDGPLNHTSI